MPPRLPEARVIRRGVTVALVLACLVAVPTLVVGRSPTRIGIGAFGAAASPTPAPSATAFPWARFPPSEDVPGPPPAQPKGAPVGRVTKHGIRLELWFSPSVAMPGEWVQAVIRATNVGRDVARIDLGVCPGDWGTAVSVDLAPVTPQGAEQIGNAALFKERVLDIDAAEQTGPDSTNGFLPYAWVRPGARATPVSLALAECTTPGGPRQFRVLPPGASRIERFAWYPVRSTLIGSGGIFQPLFPGTVPVTVDWRYGGRGTRPTEAEKRHESRTITVTGNLVLGGDGPGTPSFPELVDIALADPDFRAWVEARPDRRRWKVDATGYWPPNGPRAGYRGWGTFVPDPDGVIELVLTEAYDGPPDVKSFPVIDPTGVIYINPWTGAVRGRWWNIEWPPPMPRTSPCPSPSPSLAP